MAEPIASPLVAAEARRRYPPGTEQWDYHETREAERAAFAAGVQWALATRASTSTTSG